MDRLCYYIDTYLVPKNGKTCMRLSYIHTTHIGATKVEVVY